MWVVRWLAGSAAVFTAVVLLGSLTGPGATRAHARIERLTLREPALLRYIEGRDRGLAGSIACQPRAPYLDLMFLSKRWAGDFVLGATDCNYCDTDQDGLSGCFELILTTDPNSADTDGDCLGDGLEILLDLNPLEADSIGDGTPDGSRDTNHNGIPDRDDDYDKDGLTNCAEVTVHHTNPLEVDTDFDRLPDGVEITRGTNPLVADTDEDGFIDGEEVEFGSDPKDEESLPVDPTIGPGRVVAAAFSLENLALPADSSPAFAQASPFSLDNRFDPSGGALPGFTLALPFAVDNRFDPSAGLAGYAAATPFSLRNDSDPTQDLYGAAFRAPFSIRNTVGGKAAAGPLSLPRKAFP